MKVVILCGGQGTRMKEETEFKPKPLVTIGEKPIIWHIMNLYSHYGYNDFVLCLGYKGHMIKEYFMNFDWRSNDVTLTLNKKSEIEVHNNNNQKDWKITLAETGLETNTGGRVKKIEKYIKDDKFMVTYGDGVANIDINALVNFHKKHGKLATLTGVHHLSRFGVLEINEKNVISGFKEKPRLDGWINAGFFVFNKDVFDYIGENDVLEKDPLENLAKDNELLIYKHNDFWACMDTFKDSKLLNEIWSSGKAPWRVWK